MDIIMSLRQTAQDLLERLGLVSSATSGTMERQEPSILDNFLRERKASFLSDLYAGSANEWIVVTGNEAGDLDSIASAIGYAFLSSDAKIIPFIQTKRSDLHLRPENILAFSLASLDTSHLLTASDIDRGIQAYNCSYILVDHNRILPTCNGTVLGVLDHHEDEGFHKDAKPRTIQPVGSCASLVTVHFKQRLQSATSGELADIATLLLSAILIDTGGLKAGGKATDVDFEGAELLVPQTGIASTSSMVEIRKKPPSSLDALSHRLAQTKSSVDHLSTSDLLRRDYKEYSIAGLQIGLSTVPIGLKFLVKRDIRGFWSDIDSWITDRSLDILGVLTTYRSKRKNKHRRQLLFLVRPGREQIEKKLFDGIGDDKELACEERRIAGLGARRGRCWRQGNVKATRKTVAPLVRKILEDSNVE
ncbi:Exopolyphosphatase [Serendipita sp. 397]|nr:Exopolyphosphatase [Serendipita sp. 397]